MKKYIIPFIVTVTVILLAIAWTDRRNNKNTFFQAVGKVESDSGICLTAKEIKAIQAADVTAEYKNYLFEADSRTWNGENFCRNIK